MRKKGATLLLCGLVLLVALPEVFAGRDSDEDDSHDPDVNADLGPDLANRILREREQLKRQNKELRLKLSTAQRFADQRAALLAGEAQTEKQKVSHLQEMLALARARLQQAMGMQTSLQRALSANSAHSGRAVQLNAVPRTRAMRAGALRHRPVASLQQAGFSSPPARQRRARKGRTPHVSKAALAMLRSQLQTTELAYQKEEHHLEELVNTSAALQRAYAEESLALHASINHSQALLATAQKNDDVLRKMQFQVNRTEDEAVDEGQRLSTAKREIARLTQEHKQNELVLKKLNATTFRLEQQRAKLNATLQSLHGTEQKDEKAQANKTAKMKATLDTKVRSLNHTLEKLAAKISKARNTSGEDEARAADLDRQAKRLGNQDRDVRWESRQRKQHIADLSALADELQHNLSQALHEESLEKAQYKKETAEMQSGSAHRIKELTKGVNSQKKLLEKLTKQEAVAANKSEAKNSATLREGALLIQKTKDEIETQTKIATKAAATEKHDHKAAMVSRKNIAAARETLDEEQQKVSTLKAYLHNQKEDLSDAKAQLKSQQNATAQHKKKEGKIQQALLAKIAKQKKVLEADETQAKKKLQAQTASLIAVKKDGQKQIDSKEKLLKEEGNREKELQGQIASQHQKMSLAEKAEVKMKAQRAEDEKALKSKEDTDRTRKATAEAKEKAVLKGAEEGEKAAEKRVTSAQSTQSNAAKSVQQLQREKALLQKEVADIQKAVSSNEAEEKQLHRQIASLKSSKDSEAKALAAAQAKQQMEAKALQQQQASFASIQAQFQQASATLSASQQSAQATEAGAQESWRRLSQATSERDALAVQLRTASAASLPWLQAQAKSEAQVRQLRTKLQRVEQDDTKHKSMLAKLLAFSRSQKAKLKAEVSVMSPAQRHRLHLA